MRIARKRIKCCKCGEWVGKLDDYWKVEGDETGMLYHCKNCSPAAPKTEEEESDLLDFARRLKAQRRSLIKIDEEMGKLSPQTIFARSKMSEAIEAVENACESLIAKAFWKGDI